MAGLKGFIFPRDSTGKTSIVPDPPWHYSGDMLTIEFRTKPESVAELLPDNLSLAPDDPGAVAVIWADWQSCSADFNEVTDPDRLQYKECFVVVRCQYKGQTYSRCVYIWVDKDYAMVRGHIQGYPKKMADIWLTRPINVGKAGPKLEPGGIFGATCSAYGRRLVEAKFTITGLSENSGFVNALPMLHNRFFPRIEADGTDSINELVTMKGIDGEASQAFTGDAEIKLFESPVEGLERLEPSEMIAGYWQSVGVTWNGGTTLEDLSD